jgi:signal transduction histidine kinase/ActR/RegA family two-component response regulator
LDLQSVIFGTLICAWRGKDIMGESTSHREPRPLSLASIDALPNDPQVLKARLRDQTEAFEALARRLDATAHAEGETGFRDEQLQHFHRLQTLGTLAGGIAHEFNNILAVMLGFTEITQPLLPPDSPARHNLQEVYIAGQRAREMIRQTLSYSRSSTTVSTPVAYALLVTEVLGLLRAVLPKTIEIREEIAPDVGAVFADPASMYQILMNLCTNAAHALNAGGCIDVKVDTLQLDEDLVAQHPQLQPGRYIRLRVQDNGHGISPEMLNHIFEPFFTTKTADQGTGLGLAIVNRIVNTYHGAIAVESIPGTGTTFTVYLPHTTESTATATAVGRLGPRGKGHILLVDDEVMLAQVGQRLLERLGYSVDTCTNPNEAMSCFRAAPHQFDLVITDLTMPDMNGVQLITILRVIRPDMPVILCTGFGHTLDEEALEALGVNALLHKPIETPELAETVHRVLNGHAPNS